jgi:uncharacterized protein (TIGR03435 family)
VVPAMGAWRTRSWRFRARRQEAAEASRDVIPGQSSRMGAGTHPTLRSFRAVQKLGLKLEARKAPFDTIIIDHLEKMPTDN